jgi:hypothetical protein
MRSQPREYTSQEVLDLILNDPAAEESWREVTRDLPPETVADLETTLAYLANAPAHHADYNGRIRPLIQPRRLSRLAATLERLAPSVKEAAAHPMVLSRIFLAKAQHPEQSVEELRAAMQCTPDIPEGMRWLAKMIRMAIDDWRHRRSRVRDRVARNTRFFLYQLELLNRLDFQCAVNILGPVYKAAGVAAPVSKKRLLPPEPLPTIESLKALLSRGRFRRRSPRTEAKNRL